MNAWLLKITKAEPTELKAALYAFAYFFCLIAAYYVMRPIRDEMAVQIGSKKLNELFVDVFLAMLLLVPLFGWLTRTFPRRQLLPWIYGFFALNLLGFWFAFQQTESLKLVARIFFVWVSVFNLFAVSVFWSFMADLFKSDQAKRLYGFIAAGGTAGALVGPSLTSSLVNVLGPKGLVLISAGLLLMVIVCILALRKLGLEPNGAQKVSVEQTMQGSIWSGILDLIRSPYLLGVALFLMLYAGLSTLLYFQQIELLPQVIPDSKERIRILSLTDLAVNLLTLAIQVLAFGALMKRVGIVIMLAALPILSIFGFAAMALIPGIVTLFVFGIVRRAGEYAVSKPARETLFNVLPPEQKYRAKNVIDTLVHRGGDTLSAQGFGALKAIGWTPLMFASLAASLSIVWSVLAWFLGREAFRRECHQSAMSKVPLL
jgi:ATP:ADP antiporter, AAA family